MNGDDYRTMLPLIRSQWGLHFSLDVARAKDRSQVIGLIDLIAGERRYLQTDLFVETPGWSLLFQHCLSFEEGQLLLVMRREKEIIGFARFIAHSDHKPGRKTGNVGLSLLPQYRSFGIGTAILNSLVSIAPMFGFRKLTADVLASNTRSLNLFRKLDFETENTRWIRLPYKKHAIQELTLVRSIML